MTPVTYLVSLPEHPSAYADATWDTVAPVYRTLAEHPLTEATVTAWLATWSRFEELLSEAASRAMIAYTGNTASAALEEAHLRFSAQILPHAEEASVGLARRLVASGLRPAGSEQMLRRFETSIALFREANVPLQTELEELGAAYQRLTGGMTAEWEGVRRPLPMLAPFLERPDRAVRERAWRGMVEPYTAGRATMAEQFDRMLALRQTVARNAGFPNYRDYSFPAKFRFDYTAADCLRFHEAVEATVVPALAATLEERRRRLAVPSLRPWDLAVSPYREEPLRPYADVADLTSTAERIFARLDPELGAWFQTMIAEGLLDLESREGKAPGGYCDTLHATGRPFIFMNAAGVMDDVNTLLHEAGHAFHAFASHPLPLLWQRHAGAEAAELASMSMELLARRWIARPEGYLDDLDARITRLEHLEDVLASLAHIASVDAFQHWLYTAPEAADPEARDAAWLRIRARFDPGVDWSGLEAERVARWYRQLHIFLYPFYYIEYGIAQLGALQVWRNSLRDPEGAVRAYRRFLTLGATRPLPELYQAAGAALIFDAPRMGDLVTAVQDEIASLRGALSGAVPTA